MKKLLCFFTCFYIFALTDAPAYAQDNLKKVLSSLPVAQGETEAAPLSSAEEANDILSADFIYNPKPKRFLPSQTAPAKENFETLPYLRQNTLITFDSLSLEEKLAQTIVISTDIDNISKYKDAIKQGYVGGVLIQWGNYSPRQTKKAIAQMQAWAQQSPSKIPLLVSIDYEGGTVYTPVTLGLPYLPTNMMLAAAKDEGDTAALFYTAAQALKYIGVHINFAPVLDVNINPQNPIIGVRSFGDDTQTVSLMGAALIEGLQKGGVMAVAKHFPGHGETKIDSHRDLPYFSLSKKDLYKTHLPPFRTAISKNVAGVMSAHIVYEFLDEDNPATYSKKILTNLLKEQMGFEGIVISDSLDMGGATKTSDLQTSAARALNAGVDMILISRRDPQEVHGFLMECVDTKVPKQRVEDAARKIFALKERLGLVDISKQAPPLKSTLPSFNYYAKKITEEAITKVRAQKGIIPYTKKAAAKAQSKTSEGKYKIGAARGAKKQKLCAVFFSPLRFADQLPYFRAPFLEKGWDTQYYNAMLRPSKDDVKYIEKCMQGADLTVLGSLQWADKPYAEQKKVIDGLLEKKQDIILLSLMSPYDIKFYPQAKNVIAVYGVNKISARAAADVILGNIEAKGNLPIKL